MVGLRASIIIAVLMAFILAVSAGKNHRLHARHNYGGDGGHKRPCTNDPDYYQFLPPCDTTTDTSSTSTDSSTTSTTEEIGDNTESSDTNTTVQPTSLERAHWCRFNNGSYIPLGYSFMNSVCSLCQCTQSRSIRCQSLQCMPTYCVDNTMPTRQAGQCCTTCAYEVITNSCIYNNISFPHGAIMKMVEDKMQCWCQLGNIECRNYMGSLFQDLNMLSEGITIYIIIIVMSAVLIFGGLLCCSCTFCFYYHYKRNQDAFQQIYDQYINPAGWQPMEEEEQDVIDINAEEKRIEAEQYQYTDPSVELVPPPYSGYNDSYASEQEHKQM